MRPSGRKPDQLRAVRITRGYRRHAGHTNEIKRLIGPGLRSVVDLRKLGKRTIHLDCDVIQADGGTRTAAITGAFVALHDAAQRMLARRMIAISPLRDFVAGVS